MLSFAMWPKCDTVYGYREGGKALLDDAWTMDVFKIG